MKIFEYRFKLKQKGKMFYSGWNWLYAPDYRSAKTMVIHKYHQQTTYFNDYEIKAKV